MVERKMSMADIIVKALKDLRRNGYRYIIVQDLTAYLNKRLGYDYTQAQVSNTLTYLKGKGVVKRDGLKWSLIDTYTGPRTSATKPGFYSIPILTCEECPHLVKRMKEYHDFPRIMASPGSHYSKYVVEGTGEKSIDYDYYCAYWNKYLSMGKKTHACNQHPKWKEYTEQKRYSLEKLKYGGKM